MDSSHETDWPDCTNGRTADHSITRATTIITASATTYASHTGRPAPRATRADMGINMTSWPCAKLMTPVVEKSVAKATATRP